MYSMKIIAILFLATVSLSMVHVLVENSHNSVISNGTIPPMDINASSFSLMLQQLDGTHCGELSLGGSILTSGMKLIQKTLTPTSLKEVVILSTHCISECLILKSLLSKYQVPTIVMSLLPKLFHKNSDYIILQPPAKTLADTFFVFIKSLFWNKLGLITYYSNAYETELENYFEFMAKKNNVTLSCINNKNKQKKTIRHILNDVEK